MLYYFYQMMENRQHILSISDQMKVQPSFSRQGIVSYRHFNDGGDGGDDIVLSIVVVALSVGREYDVFICVDANTETVNVVMAVTVDVMAPSRSFFQDIRIFAGTLITRIARIPNTNG